MVIWTDKCGNDHSESYTDEVFESIWEEITKSQEELETRRCKKK